MSRYEWCIWMSRPLLPAQEASWTRGFNPSNPLLFDLYPWLRTKVHFWFVPLTRDTGSICASSEWTGFDTRWIPKSFSGGVRRSKSPIRCLRNESCHTYEWVMSHIWMSHVTHTNESRHTYEWVMSHIWKSLVTHLNESCHTYEWVMSHIWMGHLPVSQYKKVKLRCGATE